MDGVTGTVMIVLSGRPMSLLDGMPESFRNAAFACNIMYGCSGSVNNLQNIYEEDSRMLDENKSKVKICTLGKLTYIIL